MAVRFTRSIVLTEVAGERGVSVKGVTQQLSSQDKTRISLQSAKICHAGLLGFLIAGFSFVSIKKKKKTLFHWKGLYVTLVLAAVLVHFGLKNGLSYWSLWLLQPFLPEYGVTESGVIVKIWDIKGSFLNLNHLLDT